MWCWRLAATRTAQSRPPAMTGVLYRPDSHPPRRRLWGPLRSRRQTVQLRHQALVVWLAVRWSGMVRERRQVYAAGAEWVATQQALAHQPASPTCRVILPTQFSVTRARGLEATRATRQGRDEAPVDPQQPEQQLGHWCSPLEQLPPRVDLRCSRCQALGRLSLGRRGATAPALDRSCGASAFAATRLPEEKRWSQRRRISTCAERHSLTTSSNFRV